MTTTMKETEKSGEEMNDFSDLLSGMGDQAKSLTVMIDKLNDELKAEKKKKQSSGEETVRAEESNHLTVRF